jgi:hypothetical protein
LLPGAKKISKLPDEGKSKGSNDALDWISNPNRTLDKDKHGTSERVRNNRMGRQAFIAILSASPYFSGEGKENDRVSLHYASMKNGALFNYVLNTKDEMK